MQFFETHIIEIFSRSDNQWLRCDDINVRKTTLKDVLDESKEDGYIFIYACSDLAMT